MDFDKLMNRNRFFRRLTLIWAKVLITVVVLITWLQPPDIPTGTATALGVVIGILATVIAFYQWSRTKDDEAQQRREDRDNAPHP